MKAPMDLYTILFYVFALITLGGAVSLCFRAISSGRIRASLCIFRRCGNLCFSACGFYSRYAASDLCRRHSCAYSVRCDADKSSDQLSISKPERFKCCRLCLLRPHWPERLSEFSERPIGTSQRRQRFSKRPLRRSESFCSQVTCCR